MKRIFLVTGLVIISLMAVLGGCSPEKVSPPAAGGVYSGTPAIVRVTLSSSAIGSGGAATVTATVTEADTEPCPNISVTFSVISAASGTFSPATVVTDASGVATTQFTAADVNATATIRASVTVGTNTINDSAVITIGNPPRVPTAVSVSLSPANLPATGGDVTVTATVTDSTGPVSGVTVTFSTSNAAAGSLSATTATTNISGIATVTYTANAGDTIVDIRAGAGTMNNSASLQIGTPPPPTPTAMNLVINPETVGINSQAAISVTLLNSAGTAAFNNPVTLTITFGASLGSLSSSGTVTTVSLTTDASGVATATYYSGPQSGPVTIRATSGTLTVSKSLSITSDPASIALNVGNSNLLNGQTTNIEADVRNILNNWVSDGTIVNFAITAGSTNAGTLSSPQATTVNGKAIVTFTAAASNAGSLVVTASAGASPVVSATALIIVNVASTQSLEFVSATPAIIGIVGSGVQSSSVVKFLAKDINGTPKADVPVSFTLFGPTGATLAAPGGSTNAQGEVDAILQAGTVAGPARIVASATIDGTTYSTSSGNVSIGGGIPSDRWFDVSLSRRNLDGLTCNGVAATLQVWIADRFSNVNILKGTSVSFATDAGAIDASNVTDAEGLTQAVLRTQAPRPTDVAPKVGEPNYTVGSRTYNPRDGWFTVLVTTTGEEHFVDENANGVWDSTETWTDLPEPFIDSDDSGTRNIGELFFDWPSYVQSTTPNPNGIYDGANGTWDAKIPIYRMVNLVMTGPPNFGANTTRIESGTFGTGDVSIPKDGSEDFYVYVSDINMNAPIAGTKVSLSSDESAAKVKFVNGAEEIADVLSTGPAILTYRVTNDNAGATTVRPTLYGTIDWPGTCGAVKTTITYPGTITLQPGAAPAAPSLTVAAGPGSGEITIMWEPVVGATSYNLYWGTSSTLITNKITGVTSPFVHTGRINGAQYYYSATAVNSVGESNKASTQSATAP